MPGLQKAAIAGAIGNAVCPGVATCRNSFPSLQTPCSGFLMPGGKFRIARFEGSLPGLLTHSPQAHTGAGQHAHILWFRRGGLSWHFVTSKGLPDINIWTRTLVDERQSLKSSKPFAITAREINESSGPAVDGFAWKLSPAGEEYDLNIC